MLTIGLTGGIGTGKSTVAAMLTTLGAETVDADGFGRRAYQANTSAYDEVVRVFGQEVVSADGEIDRRRLGEIVFADRWKLAALTGIVWPEIRVALQHHITGMAARDGTPALVVEAAVLLEAGWDDLCDEVWVVTSPEDDVLERLHSHRGITRDIARARMRAQMSPAERERRADVMIPNDGSLEALKRTLTRVWNDRVKEKA